jgi:hypothetical protein
LPAAAERSRNRSDEALKSLEAVRAAIEALGQFVISIEEVLPQELACTSEVAKKVAGSGLEMTDRLVRTWYDVLRDGIAALPSR